MNEKKLATKAAVICYAFGDLASQFVWTFVGSYLTIFYTDIVGLAPVAVYGIPAVPMFLAVFFTARENIQPVHAPEKFSLGKTIGNLVGNKYLLIVMLIMVLQMTALMGRIAVTAYYVIYCLGSFTLISLIMTIPSIGGIIGSFFVPFFARRIGKRNVLMFSMIIQGIGLMIIYLAPFDNITMVLVGCWVFGLFNVGMPMTLSMVADSVDWMELQSGVRTDGTAYATYGLATKIGNAVGAAAGVMLLAAFGYVANAEQTPEALKGINTVVNLLPAILFFLASAACLLWNKTDKDFDDIRAQLRGEVTETSE